MTIDYPLIKNWQFPEIKHTYTEKDTMLYALSLGIGQDSLNPKQLQYVYEKELKPAGCSDFPVYEDGSSVVADLRCEAVDIEALTAWMGRAVGPEFRIVQSADREFPFLVTLSVKRLSGRRG